MQPGLGRAQHGQCGASQNTGLGLGKDRSWLHIIDRNHFEKKCFTTIQKCTIIEIILKLICIASSTNFYSTMLAPRTCHTALGPGTLGPSQTRVHVCTNAGGLGLTGVMAPF